MKHLIHILFWGIVAGFLLYPRVGAHGNTPAYIPVAHAQEVVATTTPVVATTTPPTVKESVQMAFGTSSIMVKVAQCESQFRQFDKAGVPLKNPHSSATGVLQVMFSIHNSAALKMGYDIKTLEGNIAYSKVLYQQSGTTPWNASKHCWSKL